METQMQGTARAAWLLGLVLSYGVALTLPSTGFAQSPAVPEISRAVPPGPVSGTNLPDAYVRDIARIAYLWGWPLVNLHNRQHVFAKVPENGLGDGVLP